MFEVNISLHSPAALLQGKEPTGRTNHET